MTKVFHTFQRHYWLALALVLAAVSTALAANWARTRPACIGGVPNYNYQTAVRSPIAFVVSSPAIRLDENPRIPPLPVEVLVPVPVPVIVPPAVLPNLPPGPFQTSTQPPEQLLPPPEELPPFNAQRAIGMQPRPVAAAAPGVTFSKLFQWPTEKVVIEHCEVVRPAVQIHPNGDFTVNLEARQNPGFDPAILKQGFAPTAHILRNKFQIYIRCYATGGAADAVAAGALGQPCVAEIGPIEFMVERGEPQVVRRSGHWKCRGLHDPEAFARMDRVELQFSFQR